MKRWLTICAMAACLLPAVCAAQTQGLLPFVVDSYNTGGNGLTCGLNCISLQDGVTAGDLIVVATVQPDVTFGGACPSNNNGPTWPVTDSLGNTYTAETNAATTGGAQNDYIGFAYTVSASTSATDNISVAVGSTDCQATFYYARFRNISGVKDTIVTATAGPGATPVNVSTSTTPSVNGDLLVSFAALNSGPGGLMGLGSNVQFLSSKGTTLPEINAAFGFSNGGLASVAKSQTMVRYGGNPSGSAVMQTIAFKPAAIAIVDTALPHAALSNNYSATIHGVGGAGPYTCSITAGSLQTGLSLGGVGNCTISGNPALASTNSITFRITDGTLSATKTLSLTADALFGIPLLANSVYGNFDNGGHSVSISVSCGDVAVLMLAPGADTHGSTGWIQPQVGITNFYTDTMGATFTPIPGISGIISGGSQAYLIGPMPSSGTETINGINGAGNSAALEFQILDFQNVQAIADYGSFNNNITTSPGTATFTTTFVVPVNNEYVLASTLDETPGDTITQVAPFSSLASGNDGFNEFNFGAATAVSAGLISHSPTIASGTFKSQSTQLFGLRPGLNPCGSASPNTVPWHVILSQLRSPNYWRVQ